LYINKSGKKPQYFGDLHINYSFLDKGNENGLIEVKLGTPSDEKTSLRLITMSSSTLSFPVQQLAGLDCMLVNLTNKSLSVKFDKAPKDNSPISIHKIVVDEEKGNGIYEIKDNSSLFLKVIFFPRSKGVFPFTFFKTILVVNKTQTPIDFEAPDIFVF
jgi:hypothetical protein